MYESYFGLKRRPFLLAPDTESYFSVDSMEEARQMIKRTLQSGKGFSLIFGAAGTGKTLLLQIIQQTLESEYTVAHVSNSRLETPKDLFLQIAHDLRLDPTGTETVELRLQIHNYIRQKSANGIILLFDDAQHLSPSVLEEIRLIADSIDGMTSRFHAVFAGTIEFEERLTIPHLEAFNQRIVSRCYLGSFSAEETSQYIVRQTDDLRIDPPHASHTPHSTTAARSRLPLFTEEARRRIYQLTDGVPRLINQICETALHLAAERKMQSIDGALINDAWGNFHQIEACHGQSVSETEDNTFSSGLEPVVSLATRQAQIEEIIDRKRTTFRLREFNSVEFGTLTDSDSAPSDSEVRLFHGNEYKPPYPEDDEEEGANAVEAEIPEKSSAHVCLMPSTVIETGVSAKLPDVMSSVPSSMSVKIYVPVLAVTFPKRRLVPCAYRLHRKLRRQYLLQKIQHRLGLFAKLFQKAESLQAAHRNHESDMNTEALQEYGAAILDGRPPFVRQEPHYAYQTTATAAQHTALQNDVSYPDPKTGVPIMLHWFSGTTEQTERFGVSYTDFLSRVVQTADGKLQTVKEQEDSIVRTSLNASLNGHAMSSLCPGLDEIFEESHHVGDLAVSLAELFRADSSALRQLGETAEFNNLDGVVQQQLETVVKRLLAAAEKIEQAAEVSEKAGQHVSRAAEFVEEEVKTALPTYMELFKRLSDFQEMVTAELDSARRRDTELPKFRTFPPRRQVVIERSVPTIEVEMLLR